MSNAGKPKEISLYWPFPAEKGIFRSVWNCGSAITLTSVAILSKLWLTKLNRADIYRGDNLYRFVEKRAAETALVTVSNHYSCLDDPVLWGCLRWKTILRPGSLRWGLAAHDICFAKKWHGIVFGLGRGAPVIRGDGVYQRGVNFVLDKMNDGGWLHIFPEGRVNMEKTFLRLKWGVGRVVAECQRKVVVLPFYHVGMDDILPNYAPYIPRIRKRVTILFGNPMEFDQRLENWRKSGWTAERIRKEITDAIQEELEHLKVEAYRLHAEGES